MKKYTSWRYWRSKARELRSRRRPRLALEESVLGRMTRFPIASSEDLARTYGIASEPVTDLEENLAYTLFQDGAARAEHVVNRPPHRLDLLRLRNVLCLYSGGLLTEDGFLTDITTTGVYGPNIVRDVGSATVASGSFSSNDSLEVIETPCLYMDAAYRAAYGHVLVDALPRLWALPHIPEKHFGLFTTAGFKRGYVDELLAGFSKTTPIIRAQSAALCRTLYVPVQPHMLGWYVCSQARAVWRRIGDTLCSSSSKNISRKVYFSRRRFVERRRMVDEERVEALFRNRGFTIVYPEKETLSLQVAAIRQAEVLAGPFGSAMHNSVFGGPDLRIFTLTPYVDGAYPLIDRSTGRPFAYHLGTWLGDRATAPDPLDLPWEVGNLEAVNSSLDRFLS